MSFDVTKGSQVVADGVLLFSESIAEVFTQGNEGSTHDAVSDNLVVVCLEQEENDTGREDEVPLLMKGININELKLLKDDHTNLPVQPNDSKTS